MPKNTPDHPIPSYEALSAYAEAYSKPGDAQLEALAKTCQALSPKSCGPVVGKLLTLLVSLQKPKLCLELGTWLGYSALCIAKGLPPEGRLVTCDSDLRCQEACQAPFSQHPNGHQIELRIMPALSLLEQWTEPLDFVFLDADKKNYPEYYERLIPLLSPGGLLVIDNVLWDGAVLHPEQPTDHILHALNEKIRHDPRVENMLLTVRDGLQVIRKCP